MSTSKWMLVAGLVVLGFAGGIAVLVFDGDGEDIDPDRYRQACGPRPKDSSVDERSFELAGLSLGKVALGKLEIVKKPKILGALSVVARNSLVTEYLICVAIERGDVERGNTIQVDYLRRMLQFLATGPNAEEFDRWQRDNPFPTRKGSLRLPDFVEIAGKKLLVFKAPNVMREIRLINVGDGQLLTWLSQLPDAFWASPDAGPWSISPLDEHSVKIVATLSARPGAPYQFRVESEPGSPVDAEIVLEGDWSHSDYTELQNDLKQAVEAKSARVGREIVGDLRLKPAVDLNLDLPSPSPSDWYIVAREKTDARFHDIGAATRDFIAGQVLIAMGKHKAAVIALENAVKENSAVAQTASFQAWLGKTYAMAGEAEQSTKAIAKYEKITGKKLFGSAPFGEVEHWAILPQKSTGVPVSAPFITPTPSIPQNPDALPSTGSTPLGPIAPAQAPKWQPTYDVPDQPVGNVYNR